MARVVVFALCAVGCSTQNHPVLEIRQKAEEMKRKVKNFVDVKTFSDLEEISRHPRLFYSAIMEKRLTQGAGAAPSLRSECRRDALRILRDITVLELYALKSECHTRVQRFLFRDAPKRVRAFGHVQRLQPSFLCSHGFNGEAWARDSGRELPVARVLRPVQVGPRRGQGDPSGIARVQGPVLSAAGPGGE